MRFSPAGRGWGCFLGTLVAGRGQSCFCFVLVFNGCVGSSLLRGLFSGCGERGLLFIAVRGMLIAVASLVAEHGL